MLRDGKVVSNKALHAKCRTMSMAFFHYCESNSVSDYEKALPSISEPRMVKKNYAISCRYSNDNGLSKLFKFQHVWGQFTINVLEKKEVEAAPFIDKYT